MLIYGINAVTEALRAGRLSALRVSKRSDERMRALLALAQERRVPVRRVDQDDLDRLARTPDNHPLHLTGAGSSCSLKSAGRFPRPVSGVFA